MRSFTFDLREYGKRWHCRMNVAAEHWDETMRECRRLKIAVTEVPYDAGS